MLNETQRQVLTGYLNFPLSDIMENENVSPKQALIAMQVLYEIFNSGTYNLYNQHKQTFNTLDILDSINQIIAIYRHTHPQNRTTNYPYFDAPNDDTMIVYKNQHGVAAFEHKGLLSLSAQNDNTSASATKEDIIRFICGILQQRIELLKQQVTIYKLRKEHRIKQDALSLVPQQNIPPPLLSLEKLKKQAEENYALAKAAIFKRKHNEAIDYLFVAKRNFKELKRSGINCDRMLRKIKDKLTELQSCITSRRSIQPASPAQSPITRRLSLRNINPKCIKTLKGHSSLVASVCWSPDGKFVASGSWDNTVIIWDAKMGTVLHILKGHSKKVNSVSWSPCGEFIASGSDDKTVRIWDAKKCTVVHILKGHSNEVNSVSWNPGGKFVASGSDDKTVRIWDAKKCTVVHILKGHSDYIRSVCWSPNGDFIASGSDDETVKLWNAKRGTVVRILKGHSSWVHNVRWSPNGKFIASGSKDKTVSIWDAKKGTVLHTLKGHSSDVWSISWSPDGDFIASVSWDKTVRIWDAKRGTVVHILKKHSGSVNSVSWNPGGEFVASGSHDKTIKIWKLNT